MNFEPLTPADYRRLRPFFDGQKYSLCPYSLSSIIAWTCKAYRPHGAVRDGTLFIYSDFTRQKENNHLILPISPGKEHTPEELAELCENTGYAKYWFIPEEYIERHRNNGLETFFTVERQKGYDDYVYLTKNLANLSGNRYSKKRNLIKQFERAFPDAKGNASIETVKTGNTSECIDFLERWCKERDCDLTSDESLACEKEATINALNNIDALAFDGILLRIKGVVQAFALSSRLTDTMGVLHFQKASIRIKGLYQFFDRECARLLFSELEYINKESDMEIPGLAKAKQSYHPTKMIRSYKLILK